MRASARLAWALAWWAGAGVGVAAAATVRVQVADGAGGPPVPARVSLWRGAESLLPPGFSSYSQGDERHFLVSGDFALDLAPGKYRLRIERGLEYVPVERDLDVPATRSCRSYCAAGSTWQARAGTRRTCTSTAIPRTSR
jgi:hypothetical protein